MWPTEKNVDVVHGFFFVDDWFDVVGCLRLVIFLIVSQELTRSGSSTGSVDFFDCGIYQSFVDVCDRRILTFNFGSIELEFDEEDEDGEIIGVSFSEGTWIGSEISIDGGTGFFNSRIRFNIAL